MVNLTVKMMTCKEVIPIIQIVYDILMIVMLPYKLISSSKSSTMYLESKPNTLFMPTLTALHSSAFDDLEETPGSQDLKQKFLADQIQKMKAAQKQIEEQKLGKFCPQKNSSVLINSSDVQKLMKQQEKGSNRPDGKNQKLTLNKQNLKKTRNDEQQSPFPYIPKQKLDMIKVKKVIAQMH